MSSNMVIFSASTIGFFSIEHGFSMENLEIDTLKEKDVPVRNMNFTMKNRDFTMRNSGNGNISP